VLAEPETEALVDHLERHATRLATSIVAGVEVIRAVRFADGDDVDEELADVVLGRCMKLALEESVVSAARDIQPVGLRTLDAIHLASALFLQPRAMLVYDRRLAGAARAAGLDVLSPGA
jgi:predicted nucleic acid-binding protein